MLNLSPISRWKYWDAGKASNVPLWDMPPIVPEHDYTTSVTGVYITGRGGKTLFFQKLCCRRMHPAYTLTEKYYGMQLKRLKKVKMHN